MELKGEEPHQAQLQLQLLGTMRQTHKITPTLL